MKLNTSHSPVDRWPSRAGFTLIELLVVIAVISILLALMLPVLHRARIVAYRVGCGGRLREIATAWHAYLNDNGQQFYQYPNADVEFGGWQGINNGAIRRPLNPYVGLPLESPVQGGTELFRCPADQGDADYEPTAYLSYGNSYRTNPMLVGPPSRQTSTGMPEPIRELNRRINEHLRNLKADAVCEPARLLLVGDHNWVTQWDPLYPAPGRPWHGTPGRFNLAFFDGHIAFVRIHKGIYLDSDYRVQPFKDLDSLTLAVQNQMAGAADRGPGAGS